MREYRQLTQDEIQVLENNVCWAEDWDRVLVDEEFRPYNFHRVIFYGDIRLGEYIDDGDTRGGQLWCRLYHLSAQRDGRWQHRAVS